jgi:hypothetical protein
MATNRSTFSGPQLNVTIDIANHGTLPVTDLVVSAEVLGNTTEGWYQTLMPRESVVVHLRKRPADPVPSGTLPVLTWIVFADAERRWWKKKEGFPVERLPGHPPEGAILLDQDAQLLVAASGDGKTHLSRRI